MPKQLLSQRHTSTTVKFLFVYRKTNDSVHIESADIAENNESDMTRRRRRNIEGTPNDSFLLRHIRDIPIDEYNRTVRSALIESKQEKHNMPSNITRKDEDGLYYEVIAISVNATTTDYVFKTLKHFSWYMIGVEACREPEEGASPNECSMEVKTLVRTLMLGMLYAQQICKKIYLYRFFPLLTYILCD